MTLVSAESQAELLESLAGHAQHGSAGGSAANTVTAVAHFGGSAFFTGKIGNDMHGALYRESLAEAGVEFDMTPANTGPTGACVILVTPDGERTMRTSLGAASTLEPGDIASAALRSSRIVYVEGYLLSTPLMRRSCRVCHGRCIRGRSAGRAQPSRIRPSRRSSSTSFGELPGSTSTSSSATNTRRGYTEARAHGRERLRAVGMDAPLVFMTCGADGALVFDDGAITHVPGYVVPVVDTTGAGDVFAAGALYGLTHGLNPTDAGKLGAFASAKVVTDFGARLREPLHETLEAILNGAHPLG